MIQIQFHPDYREAIIDGSKRYTTRHDFGHDVEPGDPAELVDSDTLERLREVVISLVAPTTLGMLPQWKFSGHRGYSGVLEARDHLATFYPDAHLEPNTELQVIGWPTSP